MSRDKDMINPEEEFNEERPVPESIADDPAAVPAAED